MSWLVKAVKWLAGNPVARQVAVWAAKKAMEKAKKKVEALAAAAGAEGHELLAEEVAKE
jgi:hypothetical protein